MARLDTGWHKHPKVVALGLAGMGLHAWSISYCDAMLSDGFIPKGAWPALTGVAAVVKMLVAAGLWEPVAGGYRLHDYTDWNRSRARVDEIRHMKASAGQASAQQRAQQSVEQNGRHRAQQNDQQTVQHSAEQSAKHNAAPRIPVPGNSGTSELNRSPLLLPDPRVPAHEIEPSLLAEHLHRIDQERRQQQRQIENSSSETNGVDR